MSFVFTFPHLFSLILVLFCSHSPPPHSHLLFFFLMTRRPPRSPPFPSPPPSRSSAGDGARGGDGVLAGGPAPRPPLPPGPPVLDGIGARGERTQQRGELKRRAHAEAERLVAL